MIFCEPRKYNSYIFEEYHIATGNYNFYALSLCHATIIRMHCHHILCTLLTTHSSQFLMPGLVDCHFNPLEYFRLGADFANNAEFVVSTFVPGEQMFRNVTYAREVSLDAVVCTYILLYIISA